MIGKFFYSAGGRKFALTLFVCLSIQVSATVLLALGKLTGDQWVSTLSSVTTIAVAFLGANVVEKVGSMIGKKKGGE